MHDDFRFLCDAASGPATLKSFIADQDLEQADMIRDLSCLDSIPSVLSLSVDEQSKLEDEAKLEDELINIPIEHESKTLITPMKDVFNHTEPSHQVVQNEPCSQVTPECSTSESNDNSSSGLNLRRSARVPKKVVLPPVPTSIMRVNSKKGKKRCKKFTRWGREEDKHLFARIRELENNNTFRIQAILDLDPESDVDRVPEVIFLVKEVSWISSPTKLVKRVQSLANESEFSVRDMKLLKRTLKKKYKNKKVNYEELMFQFPGKDINVLIQLSEEILNTKQTRNRRKGLKYRIKSSE